MWRAAVRQLSRKNPTQGLGFGNSSLSPFWSQSSTSRWTSGSSAAAAGQALDRAVDKDISGDARWHTRDFFGSPAESSFDQTLDAALYNVVNLPWLFMQGVPNQDASNQLRDRSALDYTRAFSSAAEVEEVEDEDVIEDECEPEVYAPEFDEVAERAQERRKAQRKQRELHKRQFKIETEAWQQAAAEYRELVKDMCKKSLAPNLPATRSFLLGWFEPLRYKNAGKESNGTPIKIACHCIRSSRHRG